MVLIVSEMVNKQNEYDLTLECGNDVAVITSSNRMFQRLTDDDSEIGFGPRLIKHP